MAFSRWMAESVKIAWIYFTNVYFNMVLSIQNSPKTLFFGLFFQEKFAKIQSPKATGHLSFNAHILVICIIERTYPQGLNALQFQMLFQIGSWKC